MKPARRGISEDKRNTKGKLKKNSVTCNDLWWFAASCFSDIEFPEFNARNYDLLKAIHEAIICCITGGTEIIQKTRGKQIPS
jgi:hypothetical protein